MSVIKKLLLPAVVVASITGVAFAQTMYEKSDTVEHSCRYDSRCHSIYQMDNGDDYVSDGLFRIVDCHGRIGYCSADSTVIIEPRFAFGYPFRNGRAKVTDCGKSVEVRGSNGEYHCWESNSWYYIDKSGRRIEERRHRSHGCCR